jgi:plastocyanin
MTEMKKIFYSTGLLFLLLACTKDKSVESVNSLEKISASGSLSNGSETTGNVVHIRNSVFVPDSIMINIGSTLAWINDDNTVHAVSSDKFDSGDILPGSMFKHEFTNTGSYYYHCKYHGEQGVVVVAGIR